VLNIKPIARRFYWRVASFFGKREIVHIEKTENRSTNIFVYSDSRVSASFEKPVIEDLVRSLEDDDIFFDIGANFGRYSCLVGTAVPTAQVFAFEPNPEAASVLRGNLRWNCIDAHVIKTALSNREGETSLDLQEGAERASIQDESGPTSDSITVRMITLDNLLEREGLPHPSVIKVDVEGAELKVIKGMRATLPIKDLRLLYCEVHPHLMKKMGDKESELFAYLDEAGFEVEVIDKRDVQYEDGGSEVQKFIRASRGGE
jgi:FkbM family methyltransferase